jgi:hypothetical protein
MPSDGQHRLEYLAEANRVAVVLGDCPCSRSGIRQTAVTSVLGQLFGVGIAGNTKRFAKSDETTLQQSDLQPESVVHVPRVMNRWTPYRITKYSSMSEDRVSDFQVLRHLNLRTKSIITA